MAFLLWDSDLRERWVDSWELVLYFLVGNTDFKKKRETRLQIRTEAWAAQNDIARLLV